MSFFQLSNGSVPEKSTEYKGAGGEIELLPPNTNVIASIDAIAWKDSKFSGCRTISITWLVIQPVKHNGHKLLQNLPVTDSDAGKRDKALSKLAVIDMIATNGRLMAISETREPTDTDLQLLLNKAALLNVQQYNLTGDDGTERKGNFIKDISARPRQAAPAPAATATPAAPVAAPAPVVPAQRPAQRPAPAAEQFDDYIPF